MSRTFDIGCDACNSCLWIGQSTPTPSRWRIYSTDEHLAKLAQFLTAHEGHPLRFFDTERRPDEWDEADDTEHATST